MFLFTTEAYLFNCQNHAAGLTDTRLVSSGLIVELEGEPLAEFCKVGSWLELSQWDIVDNHGFGLLKRYLPTNLQLCQGRKSPPISWLFMYKQPLSDDKSVLAFDINWILDYLATNFYCCSNLGKSMVRMSVCNIPTVPGAWCRGFWCFLILSSVVWALRYSMLLAADITVGWALIPRSIYIYSLGK